MVKVWRAHLSKNYRNIRTKNNDSNYFSSQEYQDEIQSKKGQIKSYDILSKTQMSDSSLWIVRVSATIAKYKVSKSAKKEKNSRSSIPSQMHDDGCPD